MLGQIKNQLKKTFVYDWVQDYRNKQRATLEFRRKSIEESLSEFDLRPEDFSKYREVPKLVQIETTNACNLNCAMCQTKEQDRVRGMMSLADFTKVADDLAEAGVKRAGLHTIGETFLHRKTEEFVEILVERGIEPRITTNAMYTDRMVSILERVPKLRHFQFSLEAATKETYEKIRRGAKWETFLESLEAIDEFNAKNNQKTTVSLKALICEDNMYQLMDIFKLKERYDCIDEIKFNLMDMNNATKGKSEIEPGVINLNNLIHGYSDCDMVFNRMSVSYDGKWMGCCRDYEAELTYGDVKTQSLLDAWNSKEANELRSKFTDEGKMDQDVCINCFSFYSPAVNVINDYVNYLYLKDPEMSNQEMGDKIHGFIWDLNKYAQKGALKNILPELSSYL